MAPKKTPQSLLEKVTYFNKQPEGFLTINEYAKRSGIVRQVIRRAIVAGSIDRKFVASSRNQKNGNRTFIINWNMTINDFMRKRRPDTWPDDFNPESDEPYKKMDSTNSEPIMNVPSDGQTSKVTTLADAKLRIEELKILKIEQELKIARNEVIKIDDVTSFHKDLASELRSVITRCINSAATRVATQTSINMCRKVIEESFQGAIEALNPLNEERILQHED